MANLEDWIWGPGLDIEKVRSIITRMTEAKEQHRSDFRAHPPAVDIGQTA